MSQRAALVIAALLVGLVCGAGCQKSEPPQASGPSVLQTKAALRQFRQAQARALHRPKDLQAQLALGKIAYEQGHYNDAYRGYQQAVILDANNADAVIGMAKTNLKLHEPVQGLDWVRRAQRLKPNDRELAELEARMHLLSGRSDAAIALFKRAVALDPGRVSTRLNLASAYALLNQDAEAVAVARQAVAVAPDNATAQYALGRFLDKAGDLAGAEAAYRQALKRDPKHAPAMLALAEALVAQGRRLEEARQLAVKASQLQSDRSESAVLAAWILHLQGDDRTAATDLIKIVNTMPQDPEAWTKLAVILRGIGKNEEAARAERMAKQFIPHRRLRQVEGLESG
ncbi:MAG: tetratricopeptide repeat protein [Armatimonadia bacterium]